MAKVEKKEIVDSDIDIDDAINSEEGGDGYQIKLEQFEGPLDLLLHLIKKAKIQIRDIFVSEITNQYLEFLNNMENIDLDKASEFLAMAAYLVEIKAKALLPKPEVVLDTVEDDGSELIRRLEEYELFKNASEDIKKEETVKIFFRPPDPTVGDERVVLKDMTLDGLFSALEKIYQRIEKKSMVITEREIKRDPFTVAQKIDFITDILTIKKSYKFHDLFNDDASISEVITTFQALLELMKSQILEVTQTETFGDIILTKIDKKED